MNCVLFVCRLFVNLSISNKSFTDDLSGYVYGKTLSLDRPIKVEEAVDISVSFLRLFRGLIDISPSSI